MKRLTCCFPILIGNRQYMPGDQLPDDDAGYVEAWIKSGAAQWCEDDQQQKEQQPKAKAVTETAGAIGIAEPPTGTEADLVGRVPSEKARGVQPEPAAKGRKRSD